MQSEEKHNRGEDCLDELDGRELPSSLEIVPATNNELEWADALSEEAYFANLFEGYDEFAAQLMHTLKPEFDSFTGASALSETLDSANQIVEVMLRTGTPGDRKRKTSLWAQVAECEEKTADLLHRLARLRRDLQKPGGPVFV